ncbi:amidase, partial [Teratosphaeria destructans]
MSSTPTTPTWQTTAQQHRAAAAAKIPPEWLLDPQWTTNLTETSAENVLSIPKECGILTARELDLTSAHDAVALLALLSSGQITSHDLTTAFCKRAAIAHQLTTCLTETLFPAALARARALDDHYATHGTPIGPLHGLPISLKDSFNIAGVHTTLGYVSFIAHGPA